MVILREKCKGVERQVQAEINIQNIYYVFIHKSKDIAWESIRFCYVVYSSKIFCI